MAVDYVKFMDPQQDFRSILNPPNFDPQSSILDSLSSILDPLPSARKSRTKACAVSQIETPTSHSKEGICYATHTRIRSTPAESAHKVRGVSNNRAFRSPARHCLQHIKDCSNPRGGSQRTCRRRRPPNTG